MPDCPNDGTRKRRKRRTPRPSWLCDRVFKRKDGKEVTYYPIDTWRDSKRVRKLLGQDYETAISKGLIHLKELEDRKTRQAEESKPRTLTFGEFWDRWVKEEVPQRRPNPNAKAKAAQLYEDHIGPHLADVPLDKVNIGMVRTMVSKLKNERTGKPLAPATVRGIIGEISCVMNYAVDCDDLIDLRDVPVLRKVRPKVPQKKSKALTPGELEAIFKGMPSDYLFHSKLALFCGLRLGEARRLTWRNVVLESQNGPHLVIEIAKNGQGRIVPLFREAETLILERHMELILAGKVPQPDDPVSPYQLRDASNIVRSTKGSGVKWNYHRLRDSFATAYINDKGGTIEALRVILGHKSIVMTEKYTRTDELTAFADVRRITGQTTVKQVVDPNCVSVVAQ